MRIGIMVGEGTGEPPDVAGIVERGRRAEALGLDTAWIAQIQVNAPTAAAALGAVTDRIEIGTAVVPAPMIHPFALSNQAGTAQQACGGRFTLGIGASHKIMQEGVLGERFDRPIGRMRECLEILSPILRGEPVAYEGEHYTTRFGPLPLGTPCSVLVAALGPQMLRLAGRLADGTITWACGPNTLAEHIVPVIREAAEAAGRSAPRIVAGYPVVVTDDVGAGRDAAARTFGHYKTLPSYLAMLEREGVAGVEELAVVGDEAHCRAELERIAASGVTDLCVFPFEVDAQSTERTWALLGELSGQAAG